ncbi:MAG: hypothetical protein Q9172_003549 [Xanthocarpia lactea]
MQTDIAIHGRRGHAEAARVYVPADLQTLQDYQDKINVTIMVLEANNDVLASLRDFYKTLLENSAFALRGTCREDVTSFTKQVDEMIHDSSMQISRAKLLIRITTDRKDLILQHLQTQTTQRMEDLTTSMQNIGIGSQKEAIIMRIITAVTLIYLPGTFVSTLFSTNVIRFDNGKEDFSQAAMSRWLQVLPSNQGMAANRLSDYEQPLRDLKAKVEACTMKAVCGRSYILVAELAQWLRSTLHTGSSTTQVGRLLMAAYGQQIPPSSTQKLWDKDNCCLLVFCILLLIEKGHLIDVLLRFDILDKHLPIPLQHLRTKLHKARIPDLTQLAAEFDEKQWAFCPAKFDLHSGQEYNEHRILPICQKAKINEKGGTANLWQIEVKEEFVGHTLKEAVAFSRYNCSRSETEPDWRYQFALKSFEDGSMTIYDNERRAFDALRAHKGMVRFLADYTHAERRRVEIGEHYVSTGNQQENETRNTFNLLLEFGECDLDEFFAQRLPPVLQDETDEFWKALFDIADALDGIHNLKLDMHGVTREFHGWHADIKPDNILSVQGKFKLSDPGFAKFVAKGEKKDPKEFVLGAPERHPGRRDTMSAVSRAIDIWSLACVFSIAATWVVFGYPGIQQFRKVREKAISQIVSAPSQPQRSQISTSISAGDYFHNGRQVLEVVTDWHKVLRNALRKTDTVTSGLLDLVDQRMLLGIASSRIKAKDLCSELKKIIVQSKAGTRIEMPGNIMETLLEADTDAASSVLLTTASKPAEHQHGADNRKARKSRLLEQPLMKTAHRSEGLKSVLASYPAQQVDRGRFSAGFNPRIGPAGPGNDATRVTSGPPPPFNRPHSSQINARGFEYTVDVLPEGGQLYSTNHTPNKHARTPKTHTPQDVFQAWEEVERKNKHNVFKIERKDELMSVYFGNRDLKFLVDNGESMKRHWAWTKFLLRTLVQKVAGQDENGLDLSFTLGQQKLENEKSTSRLWERRMREATPMSEARTDMKAPLHEILSGYLQRVKHQQRYQPTKQCRKLTLIIMTDGVWAGMGKNQHAVNDIIVKFIHGLESLVGDLVHRPVSIEFIQFGDDPEATYRLRRLDTDMKWKGIPDIIDTEPASGDVNKMLLGSFVEAYDDEDEYGQLHDPKTPPEQTASPDEFSYISSPPRSVPRRSPTSPPEPSVFISRPTA